jgi:hypothetical protein
MYMADVQRIYRLRKIHDVPRYEGFSTEKGDFLDTVPSDRTTRDWKVMRVGKAWRPAKVFGQVRKFNDYPCVDLHVPAFSARAVEALRDLLEPNGELLPFPTPIGEYYAFNLTTVADVLDTRRSQILWLKEPIKAMEILSYEFIAEKLQSFSIFRIPEQVAPEYVTNSFVDRAAARGLRGFSFQLVWPVPPGVDWRTLRKQQSQQQQTEGLPAGQTVKGNTVEIRLTLADKDSEGTLVDKQAVKELVDELNASLTDPDSDAPAVGFVEWPEYVPGECRIPISCPDADALAEKLKPWINRLKWPNGFEVAKRYGYYVDRKAREELVKSVSRCTDS